MISPRATEVAAPYLGLVATFNTLLGAFLWLAARSGRRLPDRLSAEDVLIAGMATQRLSRLLTKAEVTSPLRAPFTRVEEKGGPAEVEEAPRGTGLRAAVGKLITCPYCIGVWLAALFNYAFVLWPSHTRLVARIFATAAVADFLQALYVRLTAAPSDQEIPHRRRPEPAEWSRAA
jgi:hypothetical protein